MKQRHEMIVAVAIATVSGLSACRDASWSSPPRYDGAGYAILARALLEGRGYRAIDHPNAPPHAHFPPGYPALLAATWWITGISTTAARAVSVLCTIVATLLAWHWFRTMLPARSASLLALALAINWQWARNGASIQSEPPYMLLGQLAILAAATGAPSVLLGIVLGVCLLTRHVAIGLILAILIDRAIARRWREAAIIAITSGVVVAPWVGWMLIAAHGRTQAGLLLSGEGSWFGRIAGQLAFYVDRIPDQLTGPFVEVGVGQGGTIALTAHLWAIAATSLIVFGGLRCLKRPRRRLAGLLPLSTLAVLLVWPFLEAGRFLVPLIPCLMVGAVEGISGSWRWGRWSRRRWIASALVLLGTLPYSSYYLAAQKARALDATQRDFDAACAWLADQRDHPGPVLTQHPGEVFWQTGRTSVADDLSEPSGDIDISVRTIDDHGIAYVMIERGRYAKAPTSPLERYVERFPNRFRAVWNRGGIVIFEVASTRPNGRSGGDSQPGAGST